jgi:hypothetical protein
MASLDGYIADERDEVGPLHDWYFDADHPLVDEDHLTNGPSGAAMLRNTRAVSRTAHVSRFGVPGGLDR